jgi:GalNAc-alpha-(1->4)-GalNAc-alpha-(1->3)-diNAcBac-PP-undecaprenol alpha-1,4-N-acetyl-D-galactosaminyltransferase
VNDEGEFVEAFEQVMQEKKKICLAIPSLQAGGMERVMSELARDFSGREEVELHLVLYGISREIFYPIPEDIQIHKPKFSFNNRLRTYHTLKTLAFLRKTIKNMHPLSVLSFGEYWNNFVLLSMMGLKIPVFVSDRSQPDLNLGRFQNFLKKRLYPRARGIILQTQKAKEIYLQKHRHPNIKVIGNPIRRIEGKGIAYHQEKRVLMVGRLIQSKHQDLLIKMFSRVCPPDWTLMIVGYDHLKQQHMGRLKELSKNLGVEKQVVFTGKSDEIEALYLSSSIFAFTSSSEGFPNVIGEAMSAGLPVVAFDCVAGPSEMIEEGVTGFLAPLFDEPAFETKLERLMQNEGLRKEMGARGKEKIQDFSQEKIAEEFYQFILT